MNEHTKTITTLIPAMNWILKKSRNVDLLALNPSNPKKTAFMLSDYTAVILTNPAKLKKKNIGVIPVELLRTLSQPNVELWCDRYMYEIRGPGWKVKSEYKNLKENIKVKSLNEVINIPKYSITITSGKLKELLLRYEEHSEECSIAFKKSKVWLKPLNSKEEKIGKFKGKLPVTDFAWVDPKLVHKLLSLFKYHLVSSKNEVIEISKGDDMYYFKLSSNVVIILASMKLSEKLNKG